MATCRSDYNTTSARPSNLVQHLQPRCLEDRFLPQLTRKNGTAKARSLKHIISHFPAVFGDLGQYPQICFLGFRTTAGGR